VYDFFEDIAYRYVAVFGPLPFVTLPCDHPKKNINCSSSNLSISLKTSTSFLATQLLTYHSASVRQLFHPHTLDIPLMTHKALRHLRQKNHPLSLRAIYGSANEMSWYARAALASSIQRL
jgi:hypothetical protein